MMFHQHEIDAQVQTAMEIKMRHGYTIPAAVCRTWLADGRRFTLGFHFRRDATVGDVYVNDDGSRSEVLAVV